MKLVIVVTSLLSSALAADFGSSVSLDWSVRDAPDGQNVTTHDADAVIDRVLATLQNASTGIESEDLVVAAVKVIIATRSYFVTAQRDRVWRRQVWRLIKEVAAEKNVTLVRQGFRFRFARLRPATLSDALTLWDGLASRAQQLQETGQSPSVAVAAIGKIARVITWLAARSEGSVTYRSGNVPPSNKRENSGDPPKKTKIKIKIKQKLTEDES